MTAADVKGLRNLTKVFTKTNSRMLVINLIKT